MVGENMEPTMVKFLQEPDQMNRMKGMLEEKVAGGSLGTSVHREVHQEKEGQWRRFRDDAQA